MEDVAIDNYGGDGLDTCALRLGDTIPLLTDVYDLYITLRVVGQTNKTLFRVNTDRTTGVVKNCH